MCGCSEICTCAIPRLDHLIEAIHIQFPPCCLEHCSYQPTDHTSKEAVSTDPVNHAFMGLFPFTLKDGADKGSYLRIPLGEAGEIMRTHDASGYGLQHINID